MSLDAAALSRASARRVTVLPTCDSTNRLGREAAAALLRSGPLPAALPVFVAEEQTAGRGRLGRVWQAEPGANLTFTALFAPMLPLARAPAYVLALAAAMAEALDLRLKWPNDLVDEDDRKLGGLLAEHEAGPDPESLGCLVLGVGLNVNQVHFPGLPQAQSLHRLRGAPQDRAALLVALLRAMDRVDPRDPRLLDPWRRRSRTLGRWVRVGGREGRATGLREDGALLLDGAPVLSGDVELIAPPAAAGR